MAFGGVITVLQINDRTVRITGATLALNGVSGTIALDGGPAADIMLPATFRVAVGSYEGNPVTLQDSVDVNINPISSGGNTNLQPSVVKTGGAANVSDFLITCTNTSVGNNTQTLEIVVTFKPSGVGQPARITP
jgi:hypothetical protein